MMNKRAIELSVNFLVILILSIAILGFGVLFAKNLIESSIKFSEQVSGQIQSDIRNLLSSNERVQMIKDSYEDYDYFDRYAVGILNVNNHGPYFYLGIEPALALDSSGASTANTLISDPDNLLYRDEYLQISNNDKEVWGIGIKIPETTAPGQYGMRVWVCEHSNNVDPLPKCDQNSNETYWEHPLMTYIKVD